jgi:hypothetical protein
MSLDADPTLNCLDQTQHTADEISSFWKFPAPTTLSWAVHFR